MRAGAAEAHRRGYRVTVVEQASSVVGSSVQNFGHLCVTAQAGTAREYALAARERWLSLGSAAGFGVETTAGPIDADVVVVATHHDLDRLLPAVAAKAPW